MKRCSDPTLENILYMFPLNTVWPFKAVKDINKQQLLKNILPPTDQCVVLA